MIKLKDIIRDIYTNVSIYVPDIIEFVGIQLNLMITK